MSFAPVSSAAKVSTGHMHNPDFHVSHGNWLDMVGYNAVCCSLRTQLPTLNNCDVTHSPYLIIKRKGFPWSNMVRGMLT